MSPGKKRKLRGAYSQRIDGLAKAYQWKAENIVRFFDGLGMTKKEKVKFLAREFARVHWLAQLRNN